MLAVAARISMPEEAEEESDDELMARVLGGPGRDEAFRSLVRRHASAVAGVVRAVLGRQEGTEDVTQEVFLRVYQARERYEPGRAPFKAWLLRIARNAALNARRDGARRKSAALAEPDDLAADEITPGGALDRRARIGAVLEAVEKLPSSDRELIGLRFREELSYEEIASILGSGAAALKQKTWRALERLRSLLPTEGEP
ncbi:MAG TPA: sigma-70 family RNA polymerase sigma factor [Planctomycetota bacterium]|nr:sigma-70 family RNA polymerase sigma factor [Planctomycetota bacterium]